MTNTNDKIILDTEAITYKGNRRNRNIFKLIFSPMRRNPIGNTLIGYTIQRISEIVKLKGKIDKILTRKKR